MRLLVHLELRREPSVRREGGQLTKTEGDQCLAERGRGRGRQRLRARTVFSPNVSCTPFKKYYYIEQLRLSLFVFASALHSGEPVGMLISIRDEVERRPYAPPP